MRGWPIALVLVLLMAISCIEIYEQDFPLQKGVLLVEGMLLDHPDYQYVNIYLTDSGRIRQPVNWASVSIHDDQGSTWRMESSGEGMYRPFGGFLNVSSGTKHQLEINLGDSVRILSSWEEVPPLVEAKELKMDVKFRSRVTEEGFVLTQKGVELFASTGEIPLNQTYLRWSYDIAYGYLAPNADPVFCSPCYSCYVVEQPSVTLVSQALQSAGKSMDGVVIDFIPIDERFNVRFAVLLKQFSISKSAYEFYATIQQIQRTQGNIFDPPPAIVTGNLKNQLAPERTIYGLFEVGRYSETSASVSKAAITFLIPTFLERCLGSTLPDCSDCRLREGATKERPYYY